MAGTWETWEEPVEVAFQQIFEFPWYVIR